MKLYNHMQQAVQDHVSKVVEYSKKPYMKEFFVAIAAALLFGISYFGYNWYQNRQNLHAYAALVEIMKSYETSLQKHNEQKDKAEDAEHQENVWEDTKLLLEALSSNYKSSSLAPFFIMYQAEVALHADHDYNAACQLMEQGVRNLSKKNVYYDMFNVKRLKMLLDSPMQEVRDRAIAEMELIGDRQDNYYQQEALWTLGSYYSYYGHQDKAIAAWTKLAQQEQSDKALISSPWVGLAQEQLKTLHVSF